MEYRPDYMQCADGRITADLTSLFYGNTHYRRWFLQYWVSCVSSLVLAHIQLGPGSETGFLFKQGDDAGFEYQPHLRFHHFQLYLACSYNRIIELIAGPQPAGTHGPVLAGKGHSANNIL